MALNPLIQGLTEYHCHFFYVNMIIFLKMPNQTRFQFTAALNLVNQTILDGSTLSRALKCQMISAKIGSDFLGQFFFF